MERQQEQGRDFLNFNEQQPLPNATAVLVLGILSIVLCMPLGIVGLVLANSDTRRYKDNPGIYSSDSFSTLKAGKICSIIGVAIMALLLFFYVLIILLAISAGGG